MYSWPVILFAGGEVMDNWEKINAVQRMQDFIEENLNTPVTLYMLSRAAGYSPWHTSRVFKELTGKTPFEYIRQLRLSKAAEILRNEKTRVIDVAIDFVFDSHEGFTRAFSKQFGITPHKYAKDTPRINLFFPARIRDYYRKIQIGDDNMSSKQNQNAVFVQVVDRPARKLILKRGIKATHYFEYCEEVGCDVWDVLSGIKEALYEPIGMWLPENMQKPGTSVYAQGVEVPADYSCEVPEGFEMIDLPPCKMMIFQGQPYEDDKFEQAISAIWDVIKTYNPEIYGFKWADEDAPRFQLTPMGYRGYIEGRPVKQINT